MNIAFYAPLKSPNSVIPSGDLQMARNFIEALRYIGHSVQVASNFKTRESTGDKLQQKRNRADGEKIANKLIGLYSNSSWAPDLWFTYHLYYKAPDWIGPLVSNALDIPYVIAEASHAPKREGGPWDLSHKHVEESIKGADLVIGLNSTDAECVLPLLSSKNKYLQLRPFMELPNVVRLKPSELRPKLGKKYDLDPNLTWFLVAAMMRSGAKQQSYKLLAESLSTLTEYKWQLCVVGDGSERKTVEAYFEGLPATFVGRLDRFNLFELMIASDIFLWPAYEEAYGMAILEAQCMGLPVIAGNSGGVADIVEDGVTGCVVPVSDTAAFSKSIMNLIQKPCVIDHMSEKARLKIQNFHSLSKISRQIKIALEKVAR